MSIAWSALIVGTIASIVGLVCLVILLRVQRLLGERQRELENQVSTLDDAVRTLESCLAELHPTWGASGREQKSETVPDEEVPGEEEIGEAIEPEIQAALAAAAVGAVGPNAKLRSVREIKTRENVSAWSQQGRMLVQSSHNLRPRR